MAIAVSELHQALPDESAANDQAVLNLDAAMAFVRGNKPLE